MGAHSRAGAGGQRAARRGGGGRGLSRPAPVWSPQPGPQTALLACDIGEVFFGGARGGGKTDGMLGDFAAHALTYGARASGVFFRRTARQLEEVVHRAAAIYPALGGVWRQTSQTWAFGRGPAAGARLKIRHLWDERDADNYLGHAYTWICFEELTNWPTPGAVDRLRGTLRSAHGVKVRLRATGNPGGPGHNWVKARYVTPAPLGYRPLTDPRTGEFRVFIPSRLEDNPALRQADPGYERRLLAAGPPALVKAWRHGTWDVVAGGFFDDVWQADRHVLAPFALPPGWLRSRSFDWGSAAPASLGFWAESDGTTLADGRVFPRGSLIRTGEWYAAARPGEGLRLTSDALGAEFARRAGTVAWRGCVADPSIFAERGGPSLYDQIRTAARRHGHALTMAPADNSRVAGWQRLRELLTEAARDRPEAPGLWVVETCVDWLRTVPVLTRSTRQPDDIEDGQEDHAADETRYRAMTRRPVAARTVKVWGL